MELENINKIGVVMLGLLGDVLLRTPVIRALKDIYPNAEITAIVDPIGKEILQYNNHIDNIIVFKRNNKNKLIKQIDKIRGILLIRREQFDLIVNLYNGGSSPLVVKLSQAKYKLGFCNQKIKYIYNVKNECKEDRLKERQRLSNHMISIIEPLSSKKYSLKPQFDTPKKSVDNMNRFFIEHDYDLEKVYVLNFGSGDLKKILPASKYFYLVEYIYNNFGYIPAIISNPNQEFLQEDFINNYLSYTKIPFIKLQTLPLADIAALIQLTKFIITPDTGLMHLAMAFDNPIYCIFTYTHPIFVDPYTENFISVYEYFDENKLYQHQNISEHTLQINIDNLFKLIQ